MADALFHSCLRTVTWSQADENQGQDGVELGLDVGIRPDCGMGRVVEEGGCRKYRTSGNEGIISSKLTLSNPITNDPGELLNEVIDVSPDDIPCRTRELLVRRE